MKPPFSYKLDDYDYEEQHEKLHYQDNGVLKNLYNLMDTKTVNECEAAFAFLLEIELVNQRRCPEYTIDYYLNTHKQIFKQIYPWAGETRKIDTVKGNSLFAPYQCILKDLEDRLSKLEESLKNATNRQQLANCLGGFLAHVNNIHPFPEGNGRTQRLFLTEVARSKNFEINWSNVSPERMKHVSIKAHEGDVNPVIKLIESCLSEINRTF